jgi:hypothetical protein
LKPDSLNLRTFYTTLSTSVAEQGPHVRTQSPGFNPVFTPPPICYIKGGVNPGLNPGFGLLRCGLCVIVIRIRDGKFCRSGSGPYILAYTGI